MFKRTMLVSLAILTGGVAEAAPLPPGPPPVRDRKELRSASRRFAQQLNYVIGRIADQYVRPVKREDLLEAAVIGLYQAAHRPVPHDLRFQIRQAVNLAGLLHVEASLPGQNFNADRPEPCPVERLLISLRERLG